MTTLRPPLHELDRLTVPLNAGELRVAHKLAELDDLRTVYVQPRLAQDVPDFVATHPRHGVRDRGQGTGRWADVARPTTARSSA